MLLPVAPLAGEAQDDDRPQVDARRHQVLARLEHLRGGAALLDGLEHCVAAALHPQIGPGQSGLPQGAQFLRRLAQGAPGAGVGGHLLELREGSIQLLQDLEQLLRPHHYSLCRIFSRSSVFIMTASPSIRNTRRRPGP